MAEQVYYTKVGEFGHHIRCRLRRGDRSVEVLTTATSVTLRLRRIGSTGEWRTFTAAFVDRDAGIVEYVWLEGDLTCAEEYDVEWVVVWPTAQQKYPKPGYLKAVVQ